jgi:hypothetical protein
MGHRKAVVLVLSVVGVLLGGLWLLQGLGVVQMDPILCFADCEPVQGPSTTWAVAGILAVTAGMFGILRSRRPVTRQ